MTAINELLCWDQLYAIGGALRHIEFQPAIGAFTSATHPASVSTAPVQAMRSRSTRPTTRSARCCRATPSSSATS